MVYFCVFLFLFFCGWECYVRPRFKHYKLLYVIAFLIFVYIAGMRYNLGVDYFAYAKAFYRGDTIYDIFKYDSFESFEKKNHWELGFSIFSIILRTFTNNSQILFLVASIICTKLLFKSLKYFVSRKFFFFALLTYFCSTYMLMEMQALRQALAAGILYYAFFLNFRSRKKAVLCVFIAYLFHNSAILFIPLLFIINKRISIHTQLLFLIVSLVIFVMRIQWVGSIITTLADYNSEFGLIEKAYNYVKEDALSAQRGVFATFFLYLLVYLTYLYCNRKHGYYDSSPKLVMGQNLLWLFLLITSFTWEISYFSTRLSWYCLFGLSICLPYMVTYFERKSRIIAVAYIFSFNLLLLRPFLFPGLTQLPFSPYEDYISCELFGVKSTGKQRCEKYVAGSGMDGVTFDTK